jgi:hypothetical protein
MKGAFLIKGRSATNRGEGPLWGRREVPAAKAERRLWIQKEDHRQEALERA